MSKGPYWTKEEDQILIRYVLNGGALIQAENIVEGRTKHGCRNHYKLLEAKKPTKEQEEEFEAIYST